MLNRGEFLKIYGVGFDIGDKEYRKLQVLFMDNNEINKLLEKAFPEVDNIQRMRIHMMLHMLIQVEESCRDGTI